MSDLSEILFGDVGLDNKTSAIRHKNTVLSKEEVDRLARIASRKHNVPFDLVRGVIDLESPKYDPKARPIDPKTGKPMSSAKGLMQLIDGTAKEMGVKDPYDPLQNVMGGAKYLRMLIDRYGGDEQKGVVAYFKGPGAVDEQLRVGRHVLDIGGTTGGTTALDYWNKVSKFRKRYAGQKEKRLALDGMEPEAQAQVAAPSSEGQVQYEDNKLENILFGDIFGSKKRLALNMPEKKEETISPSTSSEQPATGQKPDKNIGLWGSLTSAAQSGLPSIFDVLKGHEKSFRESTNKAQQQTMGRGQKLAEMAEEYKRRMGDDKPFLDNLSDDDKYALNLYKLREDLSGTTALTSSFAEGFTMGLGSEMNESQRQAQADNVAETVVGNVAGTIGSALAAGSVIRGGMMKVPSLAKMAQGGKYSQWAFTAGNRGATVALTSLMRNRDDLLSGDPEKVKNVLKETILGMAVSMIGAGPETVLPKGLHQVPIQTLTDLIAQSVGEKVLFDKNVLSKEYWEDEQNVLNFAVNVGTSTAFALNDIPKMKGMNKPDFEILETRGEPVGRDFQRADAQSEATNRYTDKINAEQEARLKEMQSGGELDSPENAPRQIESGVPSYKPDEEILREAERAAYPPILRQMVAERSGQRALPEPMEEIDESGLKNMWNKIESDQAMLENMEKVRLMTLRALGGKLDPSSFDSAGDKSFNFENNRFLAKKGQGIGLDRALLDFRANYRDEMKQYGVDLDRMETPSDLVEFLRDVGTDASLKEMRDIIRINEEQYFKAVEKIESRKADVVGSEEKPPSSVDDDFERMMGGGETKQEETPLIDNDGFDWLTGQFVKANDPKFSSETGDLFEGTRYGDNRTKGQKNIDEARKQQERTREAKQRENPLEGTMFDKNEMEARATKQEDMFSKVRGDASVGKYAKRSDGGSGDASMGDYAKGDKSPSRLELPELVEYAKAILGGKAPRVKEKLSNAAASGMAVRRGKNWERIEIRADEFEDLENVEKVLAHEIGHAHTMPGNLGEKLRNVKGRMHEFFSESPDAPPPLSNTDKARLRRLAKKQLEKGFEKEVDEEIVKTTKFTPKQILDVWNSVDQGKIDPVLADYIKGLDTAQKKSIVLEAMRGNVPESVPSQQERIKTGKKIKVMTDGGNVSPKEIAKRYRELFMEEVKKRRLLDMAMMRKELWDLSQQWRPMPEKYDFDLLKYRKKDEELYADAISVFLNDPKLLSEAAPTFYRGFFGWAENRPEASKALGDLQDLVAKGEEAVLEQRDKRIGEMFKRKEEADKQEVKDRESKRKLDKTTRWLYRMLIEKGAALEEAVKSVRKSGAALPDSQDPFLKFRSLPYIATKEYAYLIETQKRVADALGWDKAKQEALGKYLLLRRAATERKGMANPLGIGGEYAEKQINYMKRKLGEKGFADVKKAADEFADVRQEDIIPFITDNNTFGKDLENYIKDNRNYARFSILKEFVKKYGKSASRSILNLPKQKGTLTGVGNPFHETITNDVMLMNAKARNDFVRSTVEMLRDNPDATRFKVEKVASDGTGGKKRFAHTENSEVKTVYYLENGKLQAYNVDREIADIMTVDPVSGSNIPAALMALGNFQRSLFIKYSPGFLMRNPTRDIKGFAVNIPKANIRKALKYTAKAFPEVWNYVKTGKMSDDMRNAMREGALPVGRSYGNDKMLKADDGYERAMARFEGDEAKEHKFVARQFQKISKVFEAVGELQEKSVKLGGYKFIKSELPDVSTEKRAHWVRSRVGTPDVFAGGKAKHWMNNLFIFSNANFQGLRAAAEAYKEDPKRFAGKMLAYEVLPKLFVAAASAGVLSKISEAIGMDQEVAKYLEDAYGRIPEHYKSRYNCVPLPFRTTSGKQFFIPLPSDHTGQTLGAMFYQAFTADIGGMFNEAIDVLPLGDASMQPSIQVGTAILTYLRNLNPEDEWTNRPIISERKYGAGLDVELYELAKWSTEKIGGSYGKAAVKIGNFVLEKVGASEVYYIDDKDFDLRDKHWFEKAVGLPVVGDALGAYIKVSDRGKSEKAGKGSSSTERKEKREKLTVSSQISEHLTETKEFDRNAARALYGQLKKEGMNVGSWSRFYRKYKREAVNRLGGPELRKIQSARTRRQREAIIESILDDRGITGERERMKERHKLMKISNLYREIK